MASKFFSLKNSKFFSGLKNFEARVPPITSGMPFSFPIILLSQISQPDYVLVNTCNNVQIMLPNANIDETLYFVRSI